MTLTKLLLTTLILVAGLVGAGWVSDLQAQPAGQPAPSADDLAWHRLYPGATFYIDNNPGKPFELKLDVQDLNLLETGARELLVKVYAPNGKTVVRQIIPDDGVISAGSLVPIAAWDHEGWYYGYNYATGSEPGFKFSAPTALDAIKARTTRTFKWNIEGGGAGIYRAVVIGSADHVVRLSASGNLPYAIAGNDNFLHVRPSQFKKSYFQVPADATKLHLMYIEYDQPNGRSYVIRNEDGSVVMQGSANGGFSKSELDLTKTPGVAGKTLTMEIADGPNAAMFHLSIVLPKPANIRMRGGYAINAAMAPTKELAEKAANGAIIVNGERYWQPWQPALDKWVKSLTDADVTPIVNDKPVAFDVKTGTFPGLTDLTDFKNVNSVHWKAPPCEMILYKWAQKKNKQELNYALRDLAQGLLAIGPGDHVSSGPIANLGYEFSNYAYQYWRPSWRVLTSLKNDVPAEYRQLISDAMFTAGDRLAFCRDWARVNGNAFSQVLSALRYCSTATGDPIHKELYEVFRDRFINGGWGERIGVGASGFVQEGFGYDHHYGSYVLYSWDALLTDLPDPVLNKVYDRMWEGYSYTVAIGTYGVPTGKDVYRQTIANPWSSRTNHYPAFQVYTDGPRKFKGFSGPDFTETVNGGNEFFAAHRPGYYALTYFGRLSPEYSGYGFDGQIGYGGGGICQVYVPEKGLVLAGSLNHDYGKGMARENWPTFHIHSLVGSMADGRPIVSAASELHNARLDGTSVSGTGEIRAANLKVTRSYKFESNQIKCAVKLDASSYESMFELWKPSPERKTINVAYEMIPFHNPAKPSPRDPATKVTVDGKDLTQEPVKASVVTIDRGGFGVKVILPSPMNVQLGKNNTLLIQVVEKPTPGPGLSLEYTLEVYGK